MAHTHKVTTRVQLDDEPIISGQEVLTGGKSISVSEAIAAEQTDVDFAIAIDVSQLKSLFMVADAEMSVTPNGPTLSGDIVLSPGKPFHWYAGSNIELPFDADITSFSVDTTGAGGTFTLEALIDPTI